MSKKKSQTGRPRSLRTPENIAWMREFVLSSLKRSAKKYAIALQISDRSVRRILQEDLNLYKMHLVQRISDEDTVLRF
ncbi:hypothetical protein C0J52_15768 [Blattella germanica]|nr:hypothetical protein C0J52_15768 [Blattella germanica]